MRKKASKIPPARRAADKAKIPLYQREFYSWLYESPRLTRWLDNQRLLNVLTFGFSSKMLRSCAGEIAVSSDVLQMGATFGDQIGVAAAKVGIYGHYDLLDVSMVQLRHQRNKYCYLYPFMRFVNGDASEPPKRKYDVVICYMLLHEVPSATRARIVNNALDCLKPGGKAVFVDYNNSLVWHPRAMSSSFSTAFISLLPKSCGTTKLKTMPAIRQSFSGAKPPFSAACIKRWWLPKRKVCIKGGPPHMKNPRMFRGFFCRCSVFFRNGVCQNRAFIFSPISSAGSSRFMAPVCSVSYPSMSTAKPPS